MLKVVLEHIKKLQVPTIINGHATMMWPVRLVSSSSSSSYYSILFVVSFVVSNSGHIMSRDPHPSLLGLGLE